MNRRSFLRGAAGSALSTAGLVAGGIWLFLQTPRFGSLPADARLERIRRSPNFRDGQFHNQLDTPMMTGETSQFETMRKFAFNRSKRLKPQGPIPSVKRDLLHLPTDENVMVWFGHSSYFLQIEGQRILVDPVLSGRASPVSFTTKAFEGTDPYTVDDLPDIDILFLTHDHWDHLDYQTVTRLRPRVKQVVCPLGVGAHLERWGYSPAILHEGDWGDTVSLPNGFTAHILPARHFSGRTLRRNRTLWASYALVTPSGFKAYLGGDSGYGPHFQQIGSQFGGFHMAILENGQYDQAWKYIHMMPWETLQAAHDLQAAVVFPVHNSKFCISNHDWDAPLRSITALPHPNPPQLITPLLGEVVPLRNPAPESSSWWTGVS